MPSQEMENEKHGTCLLCKRDGLLTFHHLIPRTLHTKKWYKKVYTEEQLNQGIDICYDCHEAVHDFITEKDLGKNYNTLSKLLEHAKVSKFVNWVARRPGRHKSERANVR